MKSIESRLREGYMMTSFIARAIVPVALLLCCLVNTTGANLAPQTKESKKTANTITIGGVALALGIAKSEAISKLEKNGCKLTNIDPSESMDAWAVWREAPIGTLQFDKGKLWRVSKDWGQFNGSKAEDLAMALFSVIENLNREEHSLATVQAISTHEPGFTNHRLEIILGGRKITISVSEIKSNSNLVDITEEINDRFIRDPFLEKGK
jgi:hypothetical protein